jgi:S1-C subfamily serine protease
VATVAPESPAARAGMKTGDLILEVDGLGVDDPNAFDYRFATKPLGGTAQLDVLRSGKEIRVPVVLEAAPDTRRDEIVIRSRSPFLGAKVANVSPALADQLHLETTTDGVVIVEVTEGSTAGNLGFQSGDLIVSVNNERISNTRELDRIVRAGSRLWRITIVRGGQEISVVLSG